MTPMMTRRGSLVTMASALTLAGLPGGLSAQGGTVHEVEMLNMDPDDRSQRMVFKPAVLQIAPGDTVSFLATDRGHNAQTEPTMIPDGAEGFEGKINEEFQATLEVEGTYVYYCLPHQATGMYGVILVGDFMSNLEAVRAQVDSLRGRLAQERVAAYLDEAEALA